MKKLLILISTVIALQAAVAQLPYQKIDSLCQVINLNQQQTQGLTYFSATDQINRKLSFPQYAFTVSIANRTATNAYYVETDGIEKFYLTENIDLSKANNIEIFLSEDEKVFIIHLFFDEGYLKNRVFVNGKEVAPIKRNYLEFFQKNDKQGEENNDKWAMFNAVESLCNKFQLEKKIMTDQEMSAMISDYNLLFKKDKGPSYEQLGNFLTKYPKSLYRGQIQKLKDNYVFEMEETPASFPGGTNGWIRHLQTYLNPSVTDGSPAGTYKVTVQFKVDKEGEISDVKAIDIPEKCIKCAAEAERVIRLSPKWIPATQMGRKVNYTAKQLITFRS